jgi:hypothetical protein
LGAREPGKGGWFGRTYEISAFIFETQKQRKITKSRLVRSGVSVRFYPEKASQRRANIGQIAVPVGPGGGAVAPRNQAGQGGKREMLQKLRDFLSLVGSQGKLAQLLGVSRPYLGRVLSGN